MWRDGELLRILTENFEIEIPEDVIRMKGEEEDIISYLVDNKFLDESTGVAALSIASEGRFLPFPEDLPLDPMMSVNGNSGVFDFQRKNEVVFHKIDENHVLIVVSNPFMEEEKEEFIRSVFQLYFNYVPESFFITYRRKLLRALGGGRRLDERLEKERIRIKRERHRHISQTQVGKEVNALIRYALQRGASDIHIVPISEEKGYEVQFRIDGRLVEIPEFACSIESGKMLINHILTVKGKARPDGLNVKDASFTENVDGIKLSVRVATVYLAAVEAPFAVLRIFPPKVMSIDELGMDPDQMELYRQLIFKMKGKQARGGLLLFVGPTGSGKNTSIYAALKELVEKSDEKLAIVTVEDPIEYHLEGVRQIELSPQISYEQALKGVVRYDPDIIYFGEIRSAESAMIVLKSALTGHLVFATMHADDTVQALQRLKVFGYDEIAFEAVRLIVAQRLVRKNCPFCKGPEREIFIDGKKIKGYEKGKGCSRCFNVGEKGRTGIFEFLLMTNEVVKMIKEENYDGIRELLRSSGNDLLSRAVRKFQQGIISLESLKALSLLEEELTGTRKISLKE